MSPRIDQARTAISEVTLVTRRDHRAMAGCDTSELCIHRVHRYSGLLFAGYEWAVQQGRLHVEREYVSGHAEEERLVGLLQRCAPSPLWESFQSVSDLSNGHDRREQLVWRLIGDPRHDRCIGPAPHELTGDIGVKDDHVS